MIEKLYPSNFQVGAEMVYTLRALDELEKNRLDGTKYKFIDIDVAGSNYDLSRYLSNPSRYRLENYPITSRAHAIERLTRVGENLDLTKPDGQFLDARIKSVGAIAKQLDSRRPHSLRDYIIKAGGLDPDSAIGISLVPEVFINERWRAVTSSFSNCSVKDLKRGQDGNLALASYNNSVRFNPNRKKLPRRVKSEFREADKRLLEPIMDALGRDKKPYYQISTASKNEYWVFWTDLYPFGISITANVHERVNESLNIGNIERLVGHEVGDHATRAEVLAERIRQDLLNPGLGVIVVPGPEQFESEGGADALPFFVDGLFEKMSPQGKFAVNFRAFKSCIERNAHLIAAKVVDSAIDPKQYLLDNIPGLLPDQADQFIKDVTEDVRDSGYRLSYGGVYEMMKYAEGLKSEPFEKGRQTIYTSDFRHEFLKRRAESMRTPAQIQALYEEVKREKSLKDLELLVQHGPIDSLVSGIKHFIKSGNSSGNSAA